MAHFQRRGWCRRRGCFLLARSGLGVGWPQWRRHLGRTFVGRATHCIGHSFWKGAPSVAPRPVSGDDHVVDVQAAGLHNSLGVRPAALMVFEIACPRESTSFPADNEDPCSTSAQPSSNMNDHCSVSQVVLRARIIVQLANSRHQRGCEQELKACKQKLILFMVQSCTDVTLTSTSCVRQSAWPWE